MIYNFWLAFFLFGCGVQEEIEPSWRNYFWNSRLRWRAQYSRYTEYTYYFLIDSCNNASDFWTEDNFCFISDCMNSFNCKLKKFVNEQIMIFYSPSNALCPFDESVRRKYFKYHTFIGTCSLCSWFNLQILNLC